MNFEAYRQAIRTRAVASEGVEAYCAQGESFEVSVLRGEIDNYSLSRGSGICVRVKSGQMGYAFTENTEDDPDRLIALAGENAKYTESAEAQYQHLYPGADSYPPSDFLNEDLLKETAHKKIELALELESATLGVDPRIERVERCLIATSHSSTGIFNTAGLDVQTRGGVAIAYVSAVARQGDDVKNGSAYDIAPTAAKLDIARVAKEAAKDALNQFDARSVSSGRYDIILSNRAAASLLGAFTPMFSADAAQKGLSLLFGKEGETIASGAINIFDDPIHPLSAHKSAFDAEGVPACRTPVVERGALLTLLHNTATAAKANTVTTGNAGKPLISGPITVSPKNFYIEPGVETQEALIKSLGSGLLITDFSGLHAGTNAVSGSFSLLARGFMVESGARAFPVEQITISGNIIELFKSVVSCASDLRFGLGRVGAPSLLISGVQVSGT